MIKTLYVIDFDGTLVDVWRRYHCVFCEASGLAVDYATYKNLKLDLEDDDAIFAALGVSMPLGFRKIKSELLESSEMLALDQLLVPRSHLLKWMSARDCVILTKRRKQGAFVRQLLDLGLEELMPCVHVVSPDSGVRKIDWMISRQDLLSGGSLAVIGDSAEDMTLGLLPDTSTIFVKSGLKRIDSVRALCRIDLSFENVAEAFDYFGKMEETRHEVLA